MAAPTAGRIVPHDLEAETAVIGSILLDGNSLGRVLDFLAREHFYREANGDVYEAAVNLFRAGRAIDPVTMAGELGRLGALQRVGGRGHLNLLAESTVIAANIEHYAEIVRARADKRALIKAGEASMRLGYDESVDAEEAVSEAQAAHYALSSDRIGVGLVRVYDLLKPAMDRIEAQATQPGAVRGVATGFTHLDRLTNGLKPSDLVIVAGRPSMGKSSWAVQVAVNAAIEHQVPVAIFSLEMPKEQLVERMLSEIAQVDTQRLSRGTVSDAEVTRVAQALGPLGDAPVWIDDSSVLDELALRVKAQQAQSRHGIGLIVVDYLQLMKGRGRRDESNRVQEVSAISRSLKAIARELHVPVIAVSQLSRAPEARPDKRPMLSDLRESGSLEQDADLVLLLFRDDYYTREKSEKPGIAEVIIAKHRNGPTGMVELMFRKEYTRFENIERNRPGQFGPDYE